MNTIINTFDTWTTAQTLKTSGRGIRANNQSLLGIQKLRELILELAVRGKLVPQDPKDEPASVLLKKIEAEKKRLIKEGKIKKQAPLPEIADDDKPENVPSGWSFARLGNVLQVINGRAYKIHEMLQEGTPLLRVGNLFTSNEWYYSDLELEPEKYIDSGDLIYSWSASFGPFIWDGGKVIYHYHIWKLDFFDVTSFDKMFMYQYLSSITQKIKASGNGIAMIHMTKERMEKLVIPLPPLAEQQRIVAKVDELMALCDQLEQQQTESNAAHQTLVELLLGALTSAASPAELEEAWQRIASHFDTLFTTEYCIDQLKQTILQLAVMGKLVPQDPNDERASELLKKIAKEKAQLVKEGKIKKQDPLPEITNDKKPFELPKGWEWTRLGSFSEIKGGKRLPSGHSFSMTETPYIYVQVTNMKNGTILCDNLKYVSKETQSEISRYTISKNDLYITIAGTIGDVGIVPEYFDGMQLTENAAKIVFQEINKTWLQKTLSSEMLQDQFIEKTKQLAQPKLALHRIESSCIPLPPLAEQHRIVAKVDELFALCDALKECINQAQTTQNLLAGAVVEQALVKNPADKVGYATTNG